MKKEELQKLRNKLVVIGMGLIGARGQLKGIIELCDDLAERLDEIIKKIDEELKD